MARMLFGRGWRGVWIVAGLVVLTACGESAAEFDAVAEAVEAAPEPEPVNGWIERPLSQGVHARTETVWRSDEVEIPVEGNGGALEYKLAMNAGDVVVYDIDYGELEHPGDMISEFHGHTEKDANGIGDLMFYAKTAGADQSGSLVAPFDGVHGWYLKNDGARDVVVRLNLAGYYELIGTGE